METKMTNLLDVKLRTEIVTDDSHEVSPAYPLYSVAAITIAAFVGSPVAAAWLMAVNYRRTGQLDKAKTSLLVGFGVTFAALVVGYFLPDNLSLPLAVGLLSGARSMAKTYQGVLLEKHLSEGGAFESKWKALGIGLIFGVVYCALIFAAVYGFSK
jgi:hypothetical protein